MENAHEDDTWDGISDEDILAVDLEQVEEQATTSASTESTKKRYHTGSSKEDDSDLVIKMVKVDEELQDGSKPMHVPPLESLRGGYLWVSDISSQIWCEQQLEYRLSLPPDVIIPEPKAVTKGSELHLARELEVQDYVNIKVTSSEDIFAVKVLNLLIVFKSILTHSSTVHREVPIFGVVDGVFILGKIDEVRVDDETFNLDIVDLKTRRYQRPPGKAQKIAHDAQVMLYKHLFDNLVRGFIPCHSLRVALKLDLDRTLGESVTKHICSSLTTLLSKDKKEDSWNLSQLLDELRNAAESLPFINQLFIDYVKYDGVWLENQMAKYLKYWKGERECQGVDVEDAWKCHSCDFQDGCKWIAKKTREHQLARDRKNNTK
ncbi:Exonuclease V-like [Homarus americanus]|uniref:Exonuclease V-like n=1 Tax=Homarus americanus TaxID=6706 RepID=A0A8J5N6B5_HOMAM|nr:Exonuclease V-like [Homarus americanus]